MTTRTPAEPVRRRRAPAVTPDPPGPAKPSGRRGTVDLPALRRISADEAYSPAEVARVFRRGIRWAREKARGLAAEGRAVRFGPGFQVPGREVLALAGDLLRLDAAPAPTETDTAAQLRSRRDFQRVMDATKSRRR